MHLFQNPARVISKSYPSLQYYLDCTNTKETSQEYVVLGLANAAFMGIAVLVIVLSLGFLRGDLAALAVFGITSSILFSFLSFAYWMTFPRVQALKRGVLIERELLFALRDLSIEMDAGTSFTEGLELLTKGYGILSDELSNVLKEMRLGIAVEDALERSMHRNASKMYKSAIVRIVNGLRSGADIPTLLSVVIENLSEEIKAQVKSYGQELNLWATLYLIIGVVLPSMGLTLLILLSSFTGLRLTESLVYGVGFFLVLFHASSVGFLRSRRPLIEL